MWKIEDISSNQLVSQKEGNFVSDMDGEKVMLSIQNGKYYNLGEIGGEIWGEIKDPITIDELVGILIERFEVNQRKCKEDVLSFLKMLAEESLINIEEVTDY